MEIEAVKDRPEIPPQFRHNCANCQFLGQFLDLEYGTLDLYWCRTKTEFRADDSVIARYGNLAREYISTSPPEGFADMHAMDHRAWYMEILTRARLAGLR